MAATTKSLYLSFDTQIKTLGLTFRSVYSANGKGMLIIKSKHKTHKKAKISAEIYNIFDDTYSFVIVLTIAHLDHDIKNNDPKILRALCQRCHLRYDVKEKQKKKENKT